MHDIQTLLASLPRFAELPPEILLDVGAAVRLERVEPGVEVVRQGEPSNDLVLLFEGSLRVVQDGRVVRLAAAPEVLGLPALFDGRHRTATLAATGACFVGRLPRERAWALFEAHPPLARQLMRVITDDIYRMYAVEATWQRHMADFFRSPNAELVPGPYAADPFPMFSLLMEGDVDEIRRVLPPRVSPMPGAGGHYLLTFNFFEKVFTTNPHGLGRSFAYHETMPFLPVLFDGHLPGFYCPEMYPDNYLAITLGREIYGFPKRFGLTRRSDRAVDVVVDGRQLLRAEWTGRHAATTGDVVRCWSGRFIGEGRRAEVAGTMLGPALQKLLDRQAVRVNVFVRKQIPECSSEYENDWAIDALMNVPFRVTHFADIEELEGLSVEFQDPSHFLRATCHGGFFLRAAFGFARGAQLADYRGREAPPVSLRARLRKRVFGG